MPTDPSPPPDPVAALRTLVLARLGQAADGSLAALCARTGAREDPGDELAGHLWHHRVRLAAWLQGADARHAGDAARERAADTTDPHVDATREPDAARERADAPHDAEIWARDPARWAVQRLIRWLYGRNQFLELDADARAQLATLVGRALAAIGEALRGPGDATSLRTRVAVALAALRTGLAALVRARLGDDPRDVVCGHYSPALQLAVLGLDVDALADPVLDIGCGVEAALVQALRARGRLAFGIDRDVDAPYAETADWLRYPYGSERWGAAISHLGFTLHFLHHHLAGRPAAYVHAEVYMQVLRSLRVDGVFAYAPGLPFIEAMLPRAQYRVTRVPLADAHRTPTLRAAQLATGLALGQATQVRRVT